MHLPEHICECMPSISPRSGGSGRPRWSRIAAELCGHACMRRPLLVASCWLVWLVAAAATTFLARRTINGNSRIASQHGNRQREPRIEYRKKKKRGNRFGKSYSARVRKNVLNGTPRLKESAKKFSFFSHLPVFHADLRTPENYLDLGPYSSFVRAKETSVLSRELFF